MDHDPEDGGGGLLSELFGLLVSGVGYHQATVIEGGMDPKVAYGLLAGVTVAYLGLQYISSRFSADDNDHHDYDGHPPAPI